jgi:transcription antitermination factor NusG
MVRFGREVVGEAPLFPRYLFARFEYGRRGGEVYETIGVSRVLGGEEGMDPWPVKDGEVERLQGRCRGGIYEVPEEDRALFERGRFVAGQALRVAVGPYAGLDGVCVGSDGRRVQIVLGLLGREFGVTVGQGQVEPAWAQCDSPPKGGQDAQVVLSPKDRGRYDKAARGGARYARAI